MDQAEAMQEPATIGGALRRAREAMGLTLPDVAERTKIRPGILTAIEGDDHTSLPALTYSLGFVKAFARTVGLDPEQSAERFRRETDKTPPAPTLIAVQPVDEKRLPSARLVTLATAAVVLLVGLVWAWGAGWFDGPTPADPASQALTAAPAVVASASQPTTPPAATEGAEGPVVLTATEDVWLRIYDRISGEPVYQGTLRKGESYTVPPAAAGANRGWLLRAGQAGALSVSVGGRAIPALGRPGEVLKHVSIAPADLLARDGGNAAPVQAPASAPAASATNI